MNLFFRWSVFLFLFIGLAACSRPAYRTRVIETPATGSLKGWQKPYEVNGERYDPLMDQQGFIQEGIASWYGSDFHGKPTSNGETYDMFAMTAAHKTLPMGTFVMVRNERNGRQVVVRVNDRGPFVKGRIIDLSYSAAKELEIVGPGTAPVRIEALGYKETDDQGQVAFRPPTSYHEGTYSIQVGAFLLPENALRLAAELRQQFGHASVQQGWADGRLFHRVRVGRYTRLEAAETAKEDFVAKGFANSFVVAVD